MFKKVAYILVLGFLSNLPVAYAEADLAHLTLEAAQHLFHENNKELISAKRIVQGAEADAITASQKPNPNLSLGVTSFNLNRSAANKNPNGSNSLSDQTLNSTVQISQLIERGDKRELRMASAKNAIKASNYDLKDAERQLLLSLNDAYYDLLLAQESQKILASNSASYEKAIQAAELRLKVGDIAASDVARMRVDLLKIQNDIRQAKANREKAQTNLAYMMGQENDALRLYAQDTWPALSPALSATQNVDARPDVLAADARTKQAEENQRLANALKTRDVNFALQYQRFPGQMPGSDTNTIGAAITIPLFTNYEYQGEISRAEVNLTSALEAKQQARASAITEISRARADLDAASEKVNRFDTQILTEAQKAADAAEFAYNHGATGITDLLDARRILRSLQLDAATAHADYAKALAAWMAATKTENN